MEVKFAITPAATINADISYKPHLESQLSAAPALAAERLTYTSKLSATETITPAMTAGELTNTISMGNNVFTINPVLTAQRIVSAFHLISHVHTVPHMTAARLTYTSKLQVNVVSSLSVSADLYYINGQTAHMHITPSASARLTLARFYVNPELTATRLALADHEKPLGWEDYETQWSFSKWFKFQARMAFHMFTRMGIQDPWLHWNLKDHFWDVHRWFKISMSSGWARLKWFFKTGLLYMEVWLRLKEPRNKPIRWTMRANLDFDPYIPYRVEDYLVLPTWEHRRTKFLAILRFLIQPIVDIKNENYLTTNRRYNIDTSVGWELDVLGVWIGVSREIYPPIDSIWFRWDHKKSTGWNRGYWHDDELPISGMYRLPDPIYRLLLKARIIANMWDGEIEDLYAFWFLLFGYEYRLVVIDNLDMSINVYIAAKENDSLLAAILQDEKLPIRPAGVKANVQLISINGPIFAWIPIDGPVLSGVWGKARFNDFDYDE